MSHEPPIPEAARSPYPLQQPASSSVESAAPGAGDASGQDLDTIADGATQSGGQTLGALTRDTLARARDSKVAIGAAVGIGSAALLAALLFARRGNGRATELASAKREKPGGRS